VVDVVLCDDTVKVELLDCLPSFMERIMELAHGATSRIRNRVWARSVESLKLEERFGEPRFRLAADLNL
jgi:hypothetical protein